MLQAGGFHTAVETTGNYSRDLLIRMMPLIDLFLFDFKHPDDAILRTVTGADGALIKEICVIFSRWIHRR